MKLKIVIFLAVLGVSLSERCVLRPYSTGLVCVCNTTYCDTLEFDPPQETGEYLIVSSSESGLRFHLESGIFSNHKKQRIGQESLDDESLFESTKDAKIVINPALQYQKMTGIGGSITGAVSYLLEQIDPALKEHIYRSYFSLDKGLAFNMIRTPIGGCDFDLEAWAYNESPVDDLELSNFTKLDDRDLLKIKHLRELKELTGNTNIKMVGTAWSPPRWMKSNNAWKGKSALKKEYYQLWADYHLRFLQLMKEQGVDFWMITTGNEPTNGEYFWLFVPFMSLGWRPETQATWIVENLGPTIRNSEFKDIKIFTGDDQRYVFPAWFDAMHSTDPRALDYIDGFAHHWYWDYTYPASQLDETYQKYDHRPILNTESSIGDKPNEPSRPVLGDWDRAEQYIKYMITQFNHYVSGWIDWNIILDEQGGPNYADNFVSAPVVVNTTSGTEMYKDTIFYALGHFSRFITPDSIRIDTSSSNSNVDVVGFRRPDGNIALIIWNKNTRQMDVAVRDLTRPNESILLNVPPRSVHSILYR